MRERWGDKTVVAHGVIYDPATLPGFVVMSDAGKRVGLVTYVIENCACEIVTIDALTERSGHGREMVDAVATVARDAGCTRLWLVTTNDNRHALAFYRSLGFGVTAVRPGAIDEARKLKPSIPWVSEDGVPITDEIELARRL
jgi:ribosomal protein S18 acetylase RimI-like enzyme